MLFFSTFSTFFSHCSDLVFALCAVVAPSFTLWRYRDLKQRGFVNSRAQLKQMIDKYNFPSGKLLSPNCRTWTDVEVIAYYETRPSERKPAPIIPRDHSPQTLNEDDLRKPWEDTEPPVKGRRGRPRKADRVEAEA